MKRGIGLLLLVLALTAWDTPHAQVGAFRFVDVAAQANLTLVNTSGDPDADYIVDSTGNGAALFDYDRDGDLDVLIVNGSTRDRLAKGGDPMAALYRNDGKGRFEDVTPSSGLNRRGWGIGVCVADYDNDGFQDVYITAFGPDVLWRNTGKGSFTDVTKAAGISDSDWSTSCAFGDYDKDGFVDLYVANYVKFDRTIPARGVTGHCRFMAADVFCGPNRLPGEADVLYRNEGNGSFANATKRAGITDPNYYGFGVVFADVDDDGWPDIYVANDSVPNLLFRNRKNGTFVEEGLLAGVALSGDGRPQAGMGVDAADHNGDGRIDIVVTNFSHDHTTLYENGPPGIFTDRSYASGVAATAGPFLGWGVKFVDADNDGRLDVFIANGHIYPDVDKHGLGTKYKQRSQILRNDGKRFRDVGASSGPGLAIERSARGAAFGDYDNDGDVDVLVINMHEPPTLLRNETTGQHWLSLHLVGTRSNRDGIGARVLVEAGGRKQTLEVGGDGSYLSHSDTRASIGLGAATRADRVEIRWPSGRVDTATNVAANRFYVAREGSPLAPSPGAGSGRLR
jgi:predicted nucleotidyltransferase